MSELHEIQEQLDAAAESGSFNEGLHLALSNCIKRLHEATELISSPRLERRMVQAQTEDGLHCIAELTPEGYQIVNEDVFLGQYNELYELYEQHRALMDALSTRRREQMREAKKLNRVQAKEIDRLKAQIAELEKPPKRRRRTKSELELVEVEY